MAARRPPPPAVKPRTKPSLEQGKVKASDLQLSSDELIAVMERVKSGNMSVDDAVCEVLAVDGNRKDSTELNKAPEPLSRSQASDEPAAGSPARLTATRPPSLSATTPTAAIMPSVSATGGLSNDEQLEVMRQVKDGSLTVDQALALAQVNGQTSPNHPVPVELKEDVALKLALADAGADVGLRQDAARMAARDAQVSQACPTTSDVPTRGVQHHASMHLGETSASEAAEEPMEGDALEGDALEGDADGASGETDGPSPPTMGEPAALSRSDSDVADILRLYGLSQAAQASLPMGTETETSVRASPAPLFSMLPDSTSISSQDPGVRVAIIANKARHLSALIALPHTYPELLAVASKRLDLDAKRIYTKTGTRVVDLVCLRDEDELFVSEGEAFRKPGRSTSLTSLNSMSSSTIGLPEPSSPATVDVDGWIKLNVGGRVFETTMTTLSRVPDNMLKTMLSSDHWKTNTDDQGAIRLDRNPQYFEPLLGYMRDGTFILNPGLSARGVLAEAHYFGLWELVDVLEPLALEEAVQLEADPPIRRAELARLLLSTSGRHGDLRCQGLNFTGSDLSRMDLSGINFRFARLDDCDLRQCQLQNCCFEGASLKGARLNQSNLMGCSFARANLESASMTDCNLHDPAQHLIANLEGANFRGADLEDCNLGGAVIRVACFKDASLRNCNLRSCNMAGADLSGCDLSGSILQGTNLRGTNTFRAKFHKISTAIHSSAFVDQGHVSFRR
eukprot:m.203627 g.203627  ORF g.203627 m.203627 type:complete len:738 (+) comp17075_c0_seq9:326-2539(+)